MNHRGTEGTEVDSEADSLEAVNSVAYPSP